MTTLIKKIVPMLLVALLLFSACGIAPDGATSGAADPAASQAELPVNEAISGTVKYAVRDNVLEQTRLWLREFNTMYPNIKVELQEFSGDLYTYLTTQATAQNMPDVVLGWDNLSAFALQNWLYPLDEFLAADAETQYINEVALQGFSYNGKTYAVPAWLLFSTLVVNLDLVEQLNMDKPGYDWTIDEFLSMAKTATTNETSGINHVESLDQYLMMQLQQSGGQWGYDAATQHFDLTSGAFEQAENTVAEMLKIPQLVADAMRDPNTVSAGGMDDYSNKFGANADALAQGKILFANQSTWDDLWLSTTLTGFEWDYYPIPAASEGSGKQIIHADYGMMLSTAQDPAAAWELLKFITFGKDGLLVRMGQQEENKGGVYENNRFTVPVSSHPEVAAFFNAATKVPEGVKYMYNNMDSSVKGDYSKVLPDYWLVVNDNIYAAIERIRAGEDAASVARETQDKINSEFDATYATFEEQMEQVQADFEAMAG